MHKTSEIFWMTTLIDQLIIRRDQCGNDGDERVKYYAEKNGHNVEYKTRDCRNFGMPKLCWVYMILIYDTWNDDEDDDDNGNQ